MNDTVGPPAEVEAANTPQSHPILSFMDVHDVVGSSITAEVDAASNQPRLLDSDPSKFRSLKQVIVIGRPGSGTDGIGDALKKLGFKVYDFQAASSRYKRDFPLWLEAARLSQEGQPYSQADYDKLIGDYNALVGAPTSFFDHEFVKLYPNVKVILVTREPNFNIIKELLAKIASRYWQRVDPIFHGAIYEFFVENADSENYRCRNKHRVISETVREKNLFEVRNFIAWVPLCNFLGVPIPSEPSPELHDNTIQAVLAARGQRVLVKMVKATAIRLFRGLAFILMTALLLSVLAFVVFPWVLGFLDPSLSSVQFLNLPLLWSQIRGMSSLPTVGIACLTFVFGFIIGYKLAVARLSTSTVAEASRRDYQRKSKYSRKKGKQIRGKQTHSVENTRPERKTLPAWDGVQEMIRKDDAVKKSEGRATLQAWKNGTHATFHVTHKQTKRGHSLISEPRKILSVTEETIE